MKFKKQNNTKIQMFKIYNLNVTRNCQIKGNPEDMAGGAVVLKKWIMQYVIKDESLIHSDLGQGYKLIIKSNL